MKRPIKPQAKDYGPYWRSYLKAQVEFLRDTVDGFSYRWAAKRAGFTSPNYILLIIQGKRTPRGPALRRVLEALQVSKVNTLHVERQWLAEKARQNG